MAEIFKGIALFTPGGDLIYCIDKNKQSRWHLDLCAALQEMLGLPEPPHFLVPGYTATIDRWLDPQTQQVISVAEAYPPVLRYQALLNAVFQTSKIEWQAAQWQEGLCDPRVLATYRTEFPQLWEDHDLIVHWEKTGTHWEKTASDKRLETPGYVMRLFVSGNNAATESTLKSLHQILERSLRHPYTLKVIDVVKHPDRAEADQVSATPTLVKVWPRPIRRIVGDLDNVDKLLQVLSGLEV
ncbi:MAG: circadian clock KaiB family protein [Hormoscilla sp.]